MKDKLGIYIYLNDVASAEKDAINIKTALEEWRHYLEGARHQFIIYTDHKNLTFPRKPEMLSQRQIRWNMFLSRFDFKLIYRAGKKSGKPDILSRRSDHFNEMLMMFLVYQFVSIRINL